MLRDQARGCCSNLSKRWQSLGWKHSTHSFIQSFTQLDLPCSRHCYRPVVGAENKTDEVPVLMKLVF